MADKPFCTTAVPTQAMGSVGLDWSGVKTFAEKMVVFLQEHGAEVIDAVDAGFRAFKAVTMRDYVALFAALNDANRDVNAIIAAIRAEFELT